VASAVASKLTTELGRNPVPFTTKLKSLLPATILLGVRLAMVGEGSTTVKVFGLVAVPPGVNTVTRPLVPPVGTTNVSVAASITVKLPTLIPLSSTVLVPVRLVPVTVTVVPTSPLAGVREASVGAGVVMVNAAGADVPPPGAGLVTLTPAVAAVARALAGTCASK
jgi:hypothetical protein